jgi:hypothetical protein
MKGFAGKTGDSKPKIKEDRVTCTYYMKTPAGEPILLVVNASVFESIKFAVFNFESARANTSLKLDRGMSESVLNHSASQHTASLGGLPAP